MALLSISISSSIKWGDESYPGGHLGRLKELLVLNNHNNPCKHAHWPPVPALTFITASLPPTQWRAGGSQPRPGDLEAQLVPRTGTHPRRGSPASTSRAHFASHPIQQSLHDALPSLLVCSPPKEQGLNPSPVSYHLGDPGQSDSTFLSLGP